MISELPPGRSPIKTYAMADSGSKRVEVGFLKLLCETWTLFGYPCRLFQIQMVTSARHVLGGSQLHVSVSSEGDEDTSNLQMYKLIQREIQAGGRAYIVCPLVEKSDGFLMEDLRAAEVRPAFSCKAHNFEVLPCSHMFEVIVSRT